MSLSLACLQPLLTAHSAIRHYIVGYSGGVDSHVLLHLLATGRDALKGGQLSAIYVDHGLQPASADWGRHCRRVCQELGVDFRLLRVSAHPEPGESPEAAARRARYGALAGLLEPDAALLTAHHQDDQAETLLLQLLRGSGPHGLAAMPKRAPLGKGWLLRPLLETPRAEILAYAKRERLAWIEDDSNANRNLDRNYLRHEVLPLLKKRWPAASVALSRAAGLCAETAALVDARADEDLRQVTAERPDCLAVSALQALDEPRRRNVLRRWLRYLNLPVPTAAQLGHILSDAVAAAGDRIPHIRWPGGEVRRYRDRLFAMPSLPAHDPAQVIPWPVGASGRSPLHIPGIGRLSLRADVVGATGWSPLRSDILTDCEITVRFRQGGERFRPQGRRHSQEIKKLLQEAAVPPWERERIPFLYRDEQLVAVAGLWLAADFAARPGEIGWVLEWQKESPSAIL